MTDLIDTPVGDGDGEETQNPFDPKRFRISQRFGEGLDARPVIASVNVRKPHRQWWFRVHPDPNMQLDACVLLYEGDQQFYLVDPQMIPALPGETSAMTLYTAINMNGGLFLWPVKLPDEEGKQHECHITLHRAADLASTEWVRVAWHKPTMNYQVTRARGQVPEPQFPEAGLQKLLSIAFADRFITDLDHPVAKNLLGAF
jgi:hypothetical protein